MAYYESNLWKIISSSFWQCCWNGNRLGSLTSVCFDAVATQVEEPGMAAMSFWKGELDFRAYIDDPVGFGLFAVEHSLPKDRYSHEALYPFLQWLYSITGLDFFLERGVGNDALHS